MIHPPSSRPHRAYHRLFAAVLLLLWHRLLILLPTPGMGRRREKERKARRDGARACWPEDRSARRPRGSAPDCPGRQENGEGSIERGPRVRTGIRATSRSCSATAPPGEGGAAMRDDIGVD